MKNADMTTLLAQFPLLEELIALKETTWFNPATTTLALLPRNAIRYVRNEGSCIFLFPDF